MKVDVVMLNRKHIEQLDEALGYALTGGWKTSREVADRLSRRLGELGVPHVYLKGLEVGGASEIAYALDLWLDSRPDARGKLGVESPDQVYAIPFLRAEQEIDPPEDGDGEADSRVGLALAAVLAAIGGLLIASRRR